MFKKVLVANRGEIARRVIRACHELGIKAVAIYSDADKNALYVREADEAYHIGHSRPTESYLNISRIIEVVKESGADAVHPGYGFLSENGNFARAVEESGTCWIGPPAKVMEMLESKCRSRQIAKKVGIPIVPGSLEPITTYEETEHWFDKLGAPVVLKIDLGGGGKGIYRVDDKSQLADMFEASGRESQAYFGGSGVYIEKLIDQPRHIEVQILAAPDGSAIHLWERECSVQRRFQKLVEESPAHSLSAQELEQLTQMAVKIATYIGYQNAGTMEFLRDKEGNFYFLEVNNRIQVEHPVTEMVTKRDLVKTQLEIAATGKIPFNQNEIIRTGHAIECRIYSEDPVTFMPAPGTITFLRFPSGEGIRVDHAIEEGTKISAYYDPLIAKLVAWGNDRKEALDRLKEALDQTEIMGIKTTLDFHRRLLENPAFMEGNYDTALVLAVNP